ncbi:MAG: Ig-like domain repeat protein, partial [Opitutaceae bacterium]|nr:Ig-like domain repeat protein [Verrucomicrobiales bacterium]
MRLQHLTLTLLLLLAGWRSFAQTNETHSFTNLNRTIPDGNYSGLSDVRAVSSAVANMTALRVKLKVAGEFNGDLYGYLRFVGGGVTNFCVLLNRVGRTASTSAGYDDSGFDIIFDDAALSTNIHSYRAVTNLPAGTPLTGAWRPDGRKVDPATALDSSAITTTLGSFTGTDATGDWTLFLADVEAGGTNLLVGWELEISGQTRPVVTWPNPADIVYGTALDEMQLNASSPEAGTFVYNPPLGTVLHAGNGQSLSVTFIPGDTASYVPLSTNVSINVLKKPLAITAHDTNKVYGAALPEFTASYSGFIAGDTPANSTTPVSFSTTAGVGSDVGVYPITPAGASSANYQIAFVNGLLAVTKASTSGFVNSSKNPTLPGESVTFTLAVSAVPPGSGIPTGTVQFKIDGSTTGSPVALSGATVDFSTTTLPAGTHVVQAEYAGDGNFTGTTNQ